MDHEVRLQLAEKNIESLTATIGRHGENFVRLDEQLKLMRESGARHNRTSVETSAKIDAKIDRMLSAFGLDGQDHESITETRSDFQFLRTTRKAKEQNSEWIRKAFVTAIVLASLGFLVKGVESAIPTHQLTTTVENPNVR